MKNCVVLLMVVGVFFGSVASAQSTSGILVLIDGEPLASEAEPFIVNDTVLVAMRPVFEALKATVAWVPAQQRVVAHKDGKRMILHINDAIALVDGKETTLLAAPQLHNGRAMVPLRFISEALGAEVLYNAVTKVVTIKLPQKKEEVVEEVVETVLANNVAIMGESVATAEQMATFLLRYNPHPNISVSPLELAQFFLDEGAVEGVRGDLAFAQSLHETGFFRYGGLVLPEQNNYCGLGATNNSGVGEGLWFDTAQLGVRAQIQHLKAYACTSPLVMDLVDLRFHYVTRGSAPGVFELAQGLNPSGIGWAYPGYDRALYNSVEEAFAAGSTYGQRIVRLLNMILDVPMK